jgi:hypothetical protein
LVVSRRPSGAATAAARPGRARNASAPPRPRPALGGRAQHEQAQAADPGQADQQHALASVSGPAFSAGTTASATASRKKHHRAA